MSNITARRQLKQHMYISSELFGREGGHAVCISIVSLNSASRLSFGMCRPYLCVDNSYICCITAYGCGWHLPRPFLLSSC